MACFPLPVLVSSFEMTSLQDPGRACGLRLSFDACSVEPSPNARLGGRTIPMYLANPVSPRAAPSDIVNIRAGSCVSTAALAQALPGSSATVDVSSAFGATGDESSASPPVSRSLSMKKSVSFVVPETYFSDEDYVDAIALQEADDVGDDDDHDEKRTLADLSWMLLWGHSDDGVVDHAAALQLAARGDDMGCLWCRGALALCYLCGWAVKQDIEHALYLAEDSATTGFGQFCLGYSQYLGLGIDAPNYTRALKRLAFIKGNAVAQFYVGQMLELGQGVVRNTSRAIRWYSLAAAAGHQPSADCLRRLSPPSSFPTHSTLSPALSSSRISSLPTTTLPDLRQYSSEFVSAGLRSVHPSIPSQSSFLSSANGSRAATVDGTVLGELAVDNDVLLDLDEMRRNPPYEPYVLRQFIWRTGNSDDPGLRRNMFQPPQGDLSSDAYRSFVRDSQSSVPLPCGDGMTPACIGIARESCLLRTDLSPAWLHPSTCMHTKNVGSHPLFHKNLQLSVLGCDPKLHKFDEAARFFVTHARKPRIEMVISGSHLEWNSNFEGTAYTVEVEDWRCQMDITDACCDRWSFISAAKGQSFDSVISSFCDSGARVKSLAMDCAVEWNWDELRRALERLVQSTGWIGKCSITFPRDSSGIVGVITSNRSTRLVTSSAMRGVSALTFWVVAWPLYSCIKSGGGSAALTSHYSMKCSWAEFFGKNCRKIRRAICTRQRACVLQLNMARAHAKSDVASETCEPPGDHRVSHLGRVEQGLLPSIGPGYNVQQQQQPVLWIPPREIKSPH